MNQPTKRTFTYCGFVLALAVAVILGYGYRSSKVAPDPLAGWSIDYDDQPAKAIDDDCQDYLKKLPPDEGRAARVGQYYKDGTGQHAVWIEVALNGTDWRHVLIYDRGNKRIKTIKYMSGHYSS